MKIETKAYIMLTTIEILVGTMFFFFALVAARQGVTPGAVVNSLTTCYFVHSIFKRPVPQ